MSELLRTPLFTEYAKLGAKTVDFGGWELPVQFSSIAEEHEAVRTKAGLFDVSHMGEFTLKGDGVTEFLQSIMTNDVTKIRVGKAQYNCMCYPDGGTIDDLLIYKLAEESYFLCVNAGNLSKDFAWINEHKPDHLELVDISNEIGQVALQGPLAEEILQKLTTYDLHNISFFGFADQVEVSGVKCLVSRTGYTGEDGFEIYADYREVASVWQAILEAGEEFGLKPCGLGARDTLRFEAGMPLYGQELSQMISPIEAGVGFAVKTNIEADFIGKEVLHQYKTSGAPRKLVGIEMVDRGIPRNGYSVWRDDDQVGVVTTGTQIPMTKRNVGMALVKAQCVEIGDNVEIEIRNKKVKAVIVEIPFYKREKK